MREMCFVLMETDPGWLTAMLALPTHHLHVFPLPLCMPVTMHQATINAVCVFVCEWDCCVQVCVPLEYVWVGVHCTKEQNYFILQFGWPKPRYDVIHLQVCVILCGCRFTSFPVPVINPARCTEPSLQTHVCLCLSVWVRACERVWPF